MRRHLGDCFSRRRLLTSSKPQNRGFEIDDAVVTVPAYFNDSQRQTIKHAGSISGFKCVEEIQPAHNCSDCIWVDTKATDERNALIYDMGGGIFDVRILTLKDWHLRSQGNR